MSEKLAWRLISWLALTALLLMMAAACAHAAPVLKAVISEQDNSSAVIAITPYPGAKDYRFRVTVPHVAGAPVIVKYAGLDPTTGSPVPYIEINGMVGKMPLTGVVEALDAVGPAPYTQPYDSGNNQLLAPPLGWHGMAMAGMNEGPAYDGTDSINGQGDPHNAPNVIAVSLPISIRVSGRFPIPSSAAARQVVIGGFNAGAITPSAPVDPVNGNFQDLYTAGNGVLWDIFGRNADTRDTVFFLADRHYMAVLFDNGTPGTNVPLHQGHGVISISPQTTFDISGERVLHVYAEVDAVVTGRRWIAFNFSPADDPLQIWYTSQSGINNANRALYLQVFPGAYAVDIFDGPPGIHNTPVDVPVAGALGQAPTWTPRGNPWNKAIPNGRGIDLRSKFDLYLSTTHAWLYENGVKGVDVALPGAGLPFTQMRAYASQYLYHSVNDGTNVVVDAGGNDVTVPYWSKIVPTSDERHWDSICFEVLPAGYVPPVRVP